MSFSNDVRNELARIIPGKECCRKAELLALMAVNGTVLRSDKGEILLQGTAENVSTARKIYQLLKETYQLNSWVRKKEVKRFKKNHVYLVETTLHQQDLWIIKELNLSEHQQQNKPALSRHLLRKICCKRAFLRGVFLARGFVNRPEIDYHLELVVNEQGLAAVIQSLLDKFGLEARQVERKNSLVVYIKESEKIVDFLRVVGASKALLDFENVRIIKSMRNEVNRQVNCETANLAKIIDASVRQAELIKKLAGVRGLEFLPAQLKELAQARIAYPDFSLKELGAVLDPPLSKSGVAYRMKKLEDYIEDVFNYDH